eukprot:842818-Rhodomonas_salina.1
MYASVVVGTCMEPPNLAYATFHERLRRLPQKWHHHTPVRRHESEDRNFIGKNNLNFPPAPRPNPRTRRHHS